MPKISIIVPVYNVDKYLGECIESILAQTYRDFELILIDDGSKDTSGGICDKYSVKDNRVRVIHTANGGVSRARNIGLSMAQGEYITFADSDDKLERDSLRIYLNAADKYGADIVRAGYYREDLIAKKTEIVLVDKDRLFTTPYEYHRWLENNKYYSFVWNAFVRRTVLADVRFQEDLSWLEDHTFFYGLYLKCNRMVTLAIPLYHYYVRTDETLSDVRLADVVWRAADAELCGKLALTIDNDVEMETAIWQNYRHMMSKMVSLLYTRQYDYLSRKRFSLLTPRTTLFQYKDERIFFYRYLPFVFRDLILRFLYMIRKYL